MSDLDERIEELAVEIERQIEANDELLRDLPEYPPRPEKRTASGVVPEERMRQKLGLNDG